MTESSTDSITLTQPDDWHLHVRDGALMQTVIAHTAARFGRAIIMPNLRPPVTTIKQAETYYQTIKAALPQGSAFEPLMVLYLTESMDPETIRAAANNKLIHAIKYYPAGATTNSDSGVRALENVYSLLEVMQEVDLPLLLHGEVTDQDVDVFDREKIFIERHLQTISEKFPELRIVLEHVTTSDGVAFVQQARAGIAATVTAHHLLMNRNELFRGGIRPHHFCLPVLKRETHRQALIKAVTDSRNTRFFAGTDSAPHLKHAKESACGCAGIYTAHAALEFYAEAFDQVNALEQLEAFVSFNGPDFYRLARNTRQITLQRKSAGIPVSYNIDHETFIPFRAGKTVEWST